MFRLLLLFLSILPISAAALPPHGHHLHSTDSRPESIEVTRPVPFDSLNPSCTLPVLSHSFGNTVGLPVTVGNYTPPSGCRWSRAVLQLSGSCNGSQSDRISAVWLSGVELLRTSTPKPTSDGIFWNVRKDVSKYDYLLRKSNISLAVMLENTVDGVNNGVYQLNLTFMYYNGARIDASGVTSDLPLSLSPQRTEKFRDNSESLNLKYSFNLIHKPADLIIPISASGDNNGFWFKIKSESDAANKKIQIPANTYKAVIELYVSFHGDDEFWYSNPPNSYIETNHLPTKSGNGAYREIEVKIDGFSVGSVIPIPVIFPGGINPLFWKALTPIGAFNLPSYELELTPFLSNLLDSKNHSFELVVTDAVSYWLVDANLHLWLDNGSDKVLAGSIWYRNPPTRVQRSTQFRQLDGTAVVQGKKQSKYRGWVAYSAGNFTTSVEHTFTSDNTVEFKFGGTKKKMKQQAQMMTKVRVNTYRQRISDTEVETKYYLYVTTIKRPELDTANLKNWLYEKTVNGQVRDEVERYQKCRGGLNNASTFQKYSEKDSVCYRRRAYANDGLIVYDTKGPPCSTVSASSW